METPQTYRRQDMLSVSNLRKMIPGKNGGPCSRQHIYNLIDQGKLSPAFRFGGRYNVCVPRAVVEAYIQSCMIDPGA